ncbi:MAG: hypothetical protein HY606_07020 [Planctomycetes bacterium]|nr:hypothetical protein [Planctomycetota bacterium]
MRANFILLLLFAQIIIITLKLLSGCKSCTSGFYNHLAFAGLLFYGALLIMNYKKIKIEYFIALAFCVHLSLSIFAIASTFICIYCLATLLVNVILCMCLQVYKLILVKTLAPLFVIVAFVLSPEYVQSGVLISLKVYVKEGCRFCEEMKRNLQSLNTEGVDIKFINGERNPLIDVFPTLMLSKNTNFKILRGAVSIQDLTTEIEKFKRLP